MCPSSGETTVFMRHLVLVILYGWLSGMQGGMKHLEIDKCKYTKNKLFINLVLFTRLYRDARPGRDADPSPLLVPRSKIEYSYTSTLPKDFRDLWNGETYLYRDARHGQENIKIQLKIFVFKIFSKSDITSPDLWVSHVRTAYRGNCCQFRPAELHIKQITSRCTVVVSAITLSFPVHMYGLAPRHNLLIEFAYAKYQR